MNIYEVRFAVNKDNTMLVIKQYGRSSDEISSWWTKYFSKGREHDDYTYVDCILLESNVNSPYGD